MELADGGRLSQALDSMLSDLGKHEELRDHAAIELTMMLRIGGFLTRYQDVQHHILGFN